MSSDCNCQCPSTTSAVSEFKNYDANLISNLAEQLAIQLENKKTQNLNNLISNYLDPALIQKFDLKNKPRLIEQALTHYSNYINSCSNPFYSSSSFSNSNLIPQIHNVQKPGDTSTGRIDNKIAIVDIYHV